MAENSSSARRNSFHYSETETIKGVLKRVTLLMYFGRCAEP